MSAGRGIEDIICHRYERQVLYTNSRFDTPKVLKSLCYYRRDQDERTVKHQISLHK